MVMTIIDSNNKPYKTRGSAHAKTACHASHWTHASEVQNSTFFITHWSSLVECRIRGYCDLGWLRHAGSQGTDLSCYVPTSNFWCTVWSQCTNITDRRTDVMLEA